MGKYGLVGKDIDYSFSRKYFSEKFEKENLLHTYQNFDLSTIDLFPKIISDTKNLKGLNVTIPYKELVIKHLDAIDEEAEKIGAVNTIKILDNNKLKGYNTDCYGFQKSLEAFLPLQQKTALILGTGGASKAIAYVLQKLGFNYTQVSRKKTAHTLVYSELNETIIANNLLIINCTPLGTSPNINAYPPLPYQYLTKHHLLFDLIYNPSETAFLRNGKLQGANTTNGNKMLVFQAEKSWEIWNL